MGFNNMHDMIQVHLQLKELERKVDFCKVISELLKKMYLTCNKYIWDHIVSGSLRETLKASSRVFQVITGIYNFSDSFGQSCR